mgnify:CR=1 FL=1
MYLKFIRFVFILLFLVVINNLVFSIKPDRKTLLNVFTENLFFSDENAVVEPLSVQAGRALKVKTSGDNSARYASGSGIAASDNPARCSAGSGIAASDKPVWNLTGSGIVASDNPAWYSAGSDKAYSYPYSSKTILADTATSIAPASASADTASSYSAVSGSSSAASAPASTSKASNPPSAPADTASDNSNGSASVLADTASSYYYASDSALADTTSLQSLATDSISHDSIAADTAGKEEPLQYPIDYSAEDSLIFSMIEDKAYLYGDAVITYGNMELKADYIEFNMKTNEVFAKGLPDSTGEMAGEPHFKDGGDEFRAREMRYNFETRNGIIKEIITEQPEGYLHSEKTKRHSNKEIHLSGGKFTTCNKKDPHFYIALTKAKMIPNDKIVSGRAYLVIEDVPLYFPFIPFGFFPNTKKHSSGLLVPEYGEEQNRGFFLRNGGYYFAINDYMDLEMRGSVFSKGTWGISADYNYLVRYKFNGGLNINYFSNATGDRDIPGDFNRSNDLSVTWSHAQSSKANPNQRFSANVNFSTQTYDRNHTRNPDNHLRNTKSSSVNYSRSWPGRPFNLSANLRHSQNSLNESVDFTLPDVSFNMNTQYPFKNLGETGGDKWYQRIQVSYRANMKNRMQTRDSLLFNHFEFEDVKTGFRHDIPMSVNFKFLRIINFSPSVNYYGRLFTHQTEKKWVTDSIDNEGDIYGSIVTERKEKLSYAHTYAPSASVSANPTLYGMYSFREDFRINAIRHVIDPSASINFIPNMSDFVRSYRDTVLNRSTGRIQTYSRYEQELYNVPNYSRRNASLSLSLRNNLEMKLRPKSDTAAEAKKVKIIDNLNMSTNYNFFKDSMRWAPVSMSANTNLFNRKLNIRLSATGDMYDYVRTENGFSEVDRYVWEDSDKLLRITRASISMGSSFNNTFGGGEDEEESEEATETGPGYGYFNVPWSFGFNYNLNYRKNYEESRITQTLSFNGNFSLTKNWKINFSSGYDFDNRELTYTRVNIFRDLHCWQMNFYFIPFGRMRSYGFTISAKAALLQDLKYDKPRESWYDRDF